MFFPRAGIQLGLCVANSLSTPCCASRRPESY